ncbi:hypothetical protein O181_052044 [Austropuccinia psidii MF-1]|uniref:Integrase zinc-binding domain-containing protein n=1 Tax=Austropuccinia psidii MF-1 TaxID=1389203 RepID=A0A9Q3DZW8_9BASI|nr:hypothetical protein [Austropuccinia psidii MF-1]
MIHIQEKGTPWEVVHKNWLTALPPPWKKDVIGYCHSCKRCQKANKASDRRFSLMIHIQEKSTPWALVHKDLVTALPPGGEKSYNACFVIVERYSGTPIFLPFHKDDTAKDTAYHPQTDVSAERMIQTLEDTVRIFFAYGLEIRNSDGFTHDWCTLIPALELSYKTSINASTGKTPAMLEKG